MPHIDYIEDSDYYNRLGSSKLYKTKIDSSLKIDDCKVSLNNENLFANECKTLWNKDPDKTYNYSVSYNGSTNYSPIINWGELPQVSINNVDFFSGVGGAVGEAVLNGNTITFNKKYTGISDDFSHSKPSLSINSPSMFMDFDGDTASNPSKCDNSKISKIIIEEIHEFGSKLESGSEIFEFTPPSGQSYVFDNQDTGLLNPNNANYLRIKEKYSITISNIWRNGLMQSGLSILLESFVEESQMYQIIDDSSDFDPNGKKIIRVEFGNSDILSAPNENTVLRYISNIQYEGTQNDSLFYRNLANIFEENLTQISSRSVVQRPAVFDAGSVPAEDPVSRQYIGIGNSTGVSSFGIPLLYDIPNVKGKWS